MNIPLSVYLKIDILTLKINFTLFLHMRAYFKNLFISLLLGFTTADLHISEITSLTSTNNDQGVSIIPNTGGGYMLLCDWQQIGARALLASLDDQGVISTFSKAEAGLTAPYSEIIEHVANQFAMVGTYNDNIRVDTLSYQFIPEFVMLVNVGSQTTAKSIAYNSGSAEYVVVATSTPSNGHGGQDIVVIRISDSANTYTAGKIIGGAVSGSTENAFTITALTVNSGYIVTGTTQTSGGTVNNLNFKLDNNLDLVWGKIGAGPNPYEAYYCEELSSGELVFSGTVRNQPTDPALFVKSSAAGVVTFGYMYSHSSENIAINGMVTASDGNIVMAGKIGSSMLLMKVDTSGSLQWAKSLLIHQETVANSISRASSGTGFIITGKTVNNGNSNAFVMQVDSTGSSTASSYLPQTVTLTSTDVTSAIILTDLPSSSVITLTGATQDYLTPAIEDTGFTQTFLFPSSRTGQSNASPASEQASSSSNTNVALIGGIAGGAVLVIIIVIVSVCCCKKKGKCSRGDKVNLSNRSVTPS